jgi:hypothetical protein
MFRLVSFFILLVFALWILPLGVFIKSSQQKTFCGGQRAICLCSHMKAKSKGPHAEQAVKTVTPSSNKEASGFSSHAFDLAVVFKFAAGDRAQYLSRQESFYSLIIAHPVEHVPKA